MQSIAFSEIEMKGELGFRSILNYTRLEGQWYRPDEVFQADKHGWPGDWEGRVILALTLLAQSTHRTPVYLDETSPGDYFEIHCLKPTNAGDVVTMSDLNILIDSK